MYIHIFRFCQLLYIQKYILDSTDNEEKCIAVDYISFCGAAVVTTGADPNAKVNI